MDKPKTHKKLILIIVISLIALAGLITGGVFLVQQLARQNSPEFTMTDAAYLVAHSPWHKLNPDGSKSDALIWTFSDTTGSDPALGSPTGSGSITTNGGLDTYHMTWGLNGSVLNIETAWLYELSDSFSFTTDRSAGTFTIVDIAEDKVTTFVPADYEPSAP